MTARLAIFDVDGTLLPDPSTEVRFARYLWRHRVLGPRQLSAYAGFCARHAWRYRRQLLKKNKAYLCGLDTAHVQDLARACVRHDLLPVASAPVIERLRAHQDAGDTVVLLSGTPQFLADALVHALGVRAGLGALCCQQEGVYCSAPPRRHPYGPSKVTAAHELARAAGLPLAQAVAYGDSLQDAHLFRVVGEAVAVRPGRQLHAVAAGEGWEVLAE